jgi:hypothetical protein
MKNHMIKKILLSIIVLLLSGCASGTPALINDSPDLNIPIKNSNLDLIIAIIEPTLNTYRNCDILSFFVIAKNKPVALKGADFGIRLYGKINNQWQQIENQMGYYGDAAAITILDPSAKENLGYLINIGAVPCVKDLKTPITVRVYVFGYQMESNVQTDVVVAAYKDVRIMP